MGNHNAIEFSIIIPALHSAESINPIIDHLKEPVSGHSHEIIVIDGSEERDTLQAVSHPDIIKLVSAPGRGIQMNKGATNARGRILVFLHADTILPEGSFDKIIEACSSHAGGAFDLGFSGTSFCMHIIACIASLRSRITRIPFGDQVLFFNSGYFKSIGGFSEIPLMEDIEIMKRIRKRRDKISIISERVQTSPDKWEKGGIISTVLRNWRLQLLYFAGRDPEELYREYYKKGQAE